MEAERSDQERRQDRSKKSTKHPVEQTSEVPAPDQLARDAEGLQASSGDVAAEPRKETKKKPLNNAGRHYLSS